MGGLPGGENNTGKRKDVDFIPPIDIWRNRSLRSSGILRSIYRACIAGSEIAILCPFHWSGPGSNPRFGALNRIQEWVGKHWRISMVVGAVAVKETWQKEQLSIFCW
jgi:hypothetical protein